MRHLRFALAVLIVSYLITSLKSATGQSNCTLQPVGDINCNGVIGLEDFEIWRKGYLGITGTPGPTITITGTTPTITNITTPTITSATTPTVTLIPTLSVTPPPGSSPQSEQVVNFSTLPQAVKDAVNQKYPNNSIVEAKKLTYSNGAIQYEVQLDDAQGNTWDVFILPNGVITLFEPA